MAEVRIENVTKQFGDVIAVNDLNLVIKEKEFLTLLGPSGCGKTTLLNCIAGLLEVTKGSIYIDGQLINPIPPKDRGIAMVFQDYALYPHMTVYDNLAFPLKAMKLSTSEISLKTTEAAEILNIVELLNRLPRELSGGQRQRVALGRAIVRRPRVFLMDEPLSNLDARLRLMMRSELKKLHRKLGATVIYVTHDQAEAMTLSDRIAVLKDGILQQLDTPLALYEKPANKFIADFLGAVSMNFVQGLIERKESTYYLEAGTFCYAIPQKYTDIVQHLSPHTGVILGIRPENVSLSKNRTEGQIQARVDNVDQLGSDQYVHVLAHECLLIVRVPPHMKLELHETVYLALDEDKIHFFDEKTGELFL
jgi:multiple sugar transport system ATP-binding protein